MLVVDDTHLRYYLSTRPGPDSTGAAYGYAVAPSGEVYVWARHRDSPNPSWPAFWEDEVSRSAIYPKEQALIAAGYVLVDPAHVKPERTPWGAYLHYAPPQYMAQML